MLRASMKRVDITPPVGLELAGYPHYPRYNKGAHDPLFASCMYLQTDREEICMITLDLLFFSKKHVMELRRLAEEACGINGDHIMISCSHTHSGPWASGRLDIESLEAGKEQPHEYISSIISKVIRMIGEAKLEAAAASFGYGTALCGAESGVGGNRRIPGGPHDPIVSVMAIRDESRAIRGIIVNYTLHPSFIHEWSDVCTADYPCYVKRQLEELEPAAIVGFAQGTSGNQSSRYYRRGESFEEAERVGRLIGKAAYTALQNANWSDALEIAVANAKLSIELRNFGTEDELIAKVAKDKTIYKDLYSRFGSSKKREEYYLWQNANLKLLGSEDQLGYVKMRNKGAKIELYEDENPAEIQAFRLGGLCVIGLPGEIFVEYGLYVKAMAGFGTVIVNELTNGCLPGYVYTPESLVTGGYETDTSMLCEDFGMRLTELAIYTARDLYRKER